MASQYYLPPWNANIAYKKFDVFYDYYIGGNLVYGYATQDNVGQHPSGIYTFNVTAYSRVEDVTTLSFTQTGAAMASVQAGSLIRVRGLTANTSVEYTGMCIGGGSGYAQYINPGWSQTDNAVVAGTVNLNNPAFTTGFFFIPTYSTKIDTKNKPIVAKLGDSYEQRSPQSLNTFDQTYSMVFQQRSDKEARAITNYVEDAAGVRCFPIVIPVAAFSNQPNQKFVADDVSVVPASYSLNDVQVSVRRVFDL